MENYKKILKKIFNDLVIIDEDFKVFRDLKSFDVEYKANYLYIYVNQDNLQFLKKNKDLVNEAIEKELNKKIHVFYELNFCEIRQELNSEKLIFFKKNNYKNFVFHSDNRSIFHTIRNVVFEENEINIIYIWGAEGIGKTHFICALLDKYEESFFDKQTLYINMHDFSNKYYSFVKDYKNQKKFIDIFLKYDVLVFDDFQQLKNKKNIEKIISLLTLGAIKLNKKIIFINTSKNNSLSWLDEELIALIVNSYNLKLIGPGTNNLKLIISNFIQKQNPNLKITAESVNYLSLLLGNNIHVIIDRILKILMFFENPHSLKIITLDELKKVLEKISFFKKTKNLIDYSNNQQLKIICKKIGFNNQELLSNVRKATIVLNRNIIIYIFKKKFNFSHEYIGKIFNKNHSTITHSLKEINKKLKEKDFKNYLETLIEKIF